MNYYNPDDYASDSLDADPRSDGPYWIEEEDGSGYWSDGWSGDEYGYTDDTDDYPYEDGDEWLGGPTNLDDEDIPF